jgi:hypothetical protein
VNVEPNIKTAPNRAPDLFVIDVHLQN